MRPVFAEDNLAKESFKNDEDVLFVRGTGNCNGIYYNGDNSIAPGHLALKYQNNQWKFQVWHLNKKVPTFEVKLSKRFSLEGYEESRSFFRNFTFNGRINLNFENKVKVRFNIANFERDRKVLEKMAEIFEGFLKKKNGVKSPVKALKFNGETTKSRLDRGGNVEKLKLRSSSNKILELKNEKISATSPKNREVPEFTTKSGKVSELTTKSGKVSELTTKSGKVSELTPKNRKSLDSSPKLVKLNGHMTSSGMEEKKISRETRSSKNIISLFPKRSRVFPTEANLSVNSNSTQKNSPHQNLATSSPLSSREENKPRRSLSSAQCRNMKTEENGITKRPMVNGFKETVNGNVESPRNNKFGSTFFYTKEPKDGLSSSFYSSKRGLLPSSPSLSPKTSSSGYKRVLDTSNPTESSPKKLKNHSFDKENDYLGRIGFINLGNTCYMNATLQALFSLDPLMEKLHEYKHHAADNGLWKPLLDLYYFRFKYADGEKEERLVKFRERLVDKTNLFADVDVMEDSHELLGKILSEIEDEYQTSTCNLKHNIITHNIALEVQTTYTCNSCSETRSQTDRVNDLGLVVPWTESQENTCLKLQTMVDEYFDKSSVVELYCKCSSEPQEARIATKISRLSPILTIQLKRYYVEDGHSLKNTTPVSIPLELNLRKYCRSEDIALLNNRHNNSVQNGFAIEPKTIEEEKLQMEEALNRSKDESEDKGFVYTLQAVIEHAGSRTASGHYVSRVKRNSNWFKCNDETVTRIEADSTDEHDVYILFYVLK